MLGYYHDVPKGTQTRPGPNADLSDDVSSDLSFEALAKEEALAKGEAPGVSDDGAKSDTPIRRQRRQRRQRQTPNADLSDDVSSDLSFEALAKEEALAKGEAPGVSDDGAKSETPNAHYIHDRYRRRYQVFTI